MAWKRSWFLGVFFTFFYFEPPKHLLWKTFFKFWVRIIYQLLKLIWDCGISFSSGTFKDGLKCACCQTINFVQGSGEAHAVWKLTYSSHHSFDLKKKYIYNSESTLYNQLLKLIRGCGISPNSNTYGPSDLLIPRVRANSTPLINVNNIIWSWVYFPPIYPPAPLPCPHTLPPLFVPSGTQ